MATPPSFLFTCVLDSARLAATRLTAGMSRALSHAVVLAASVALAACASLPVDVARPISRAEAGGTMTTLGRVAAASLPPADDSTSGFRLLADGEEAFQARLALIRHAEKSLDLQYYLIADDRTGREFLAAARDAAARGVRVRILVDDLYATGEDALYASLARRPNIEVRMFNPLATRSDSYRWRIAASLPELPRINHRMHNKLLLADGAFAVVGGRNVADDYFGRGAAAHFVDMDALAAGPVVAELSSVFDDYWNCDRAYPVASLVADDEPGHASAAARLDAARDRATPPSGALDVQISHGRVLLSPARAEVLADRPQKQSAAKGGRVTAGHLQLVASARSEVLLASPYFVPSNAVLAALGKLAGGGSVRVSVLTNSLAATDEPVVHLGYMAHRVQLLQAGVELHELLPVVDNDAEPDAGNNDPSRPPLDSHSAGRLHAKLAVIDRQSIFLGSMNMDRRSEDFNTEDGLIIHSPALAAQVATFLGREEGNASYELKFDTRFGRIVWVSGHGDHRVESNTEAPARSGGGFGMRLVVRMAEDML